MICSLSRLCRGVVLSTLFIFSASAAAQTIKGTVKVATELTKKVTPSAVLFVIARPAGTQGGPPAAVLRIASPKFPQAFELGAQNLMAGGEFKGPYDLTAKLSKTGDAMTSSGDLLGTSDAKKGFSAGAKDAEIILNKEAP